VNRFARRHVDGRGAHVEPGVEHHLGRSAGVLVVQVSQHDVFPGANAPGDCLTDRSCSDDDDDFAHGELLTCGARRRTAQNPP